MRMHMFESRTLFTLIEEHQNVYYYQQQHQKQQHICAVFVCCYLHSIPLAPYHTCIVYELPSGRSLRLIHAMCVCEMGVYQEKKTKKEQFVTSPDKYVYVYYKSNHLPVCVKRLIGTSSVSVWVHVVVARANNTN